MSQHLTIIEAAKYLNRSTKTIRKYIKDRKLKAIMEPAQFGNRYVIPLEALEAFKEESLTHTPTIENQLVEVTPTLPLEAIESLLEANRQATREDLQALKREIIAAVLEGMRKEKKPLIRRFVDWWRG